MNKAETATHSARPPAISGSERGVILVWALLTALLVAGVVLATSDEIRAVDRQASFEFSVKGQVEEVAQAGLTDALAWFRRQSTQPVATFEPKGLPPSLRPAHTHPRLAMFPVALGGEGNGIRDGGNRIDELGQIATADGVKDYRVTTSNGVIHVSYLLDGQKYGFEYDQTSTKGLPRSLARELEAASYYSLSTIDSETPELGLVRFYELAPQVWARYTVSRGIPSEPFNDANGNGTHDASESFTDLDGDGRWSAGMHTRDVSGSRGANGAGTVWYVTSVGEIFRRPRPDLALGAGPNTRLALSAWGTELRRLTIAAPASAALCVQDGGRCQIGARTTIRGGTAIAYDQSGGDPSIRGGKVVGNLAALPDLKTSYEAVFGVPWTRLMAMADLSTSKPQGALPTPLPASSLVVIMGDVRFDEAQPLQGSAVVVVRGNCAIERGSNSFFTGVLYVDGNLSINGPALLRGTVITTGACAIRGLGSEAVEIEHDAGVASEMLGRIGQYRPAKAPFRLREKFDGVPDPAAPPPPPISGGGPGNSRSAGNSGNASNSPSSVGPGNSIGPGSSLGAGNSGGSTKSPGGKKGSGSGTSSGGKGGRRKK